ncbi:MAG: YabP/YqfC family sporulation protein [Ruminococcus sp.]|jgi:sporulation protein YqfC|nr:YabP/YqfC family sporulation protein [Ruminococcus sp.]
MRKKRNKITNKLPTEFRSDLPVIEFTGNRKVVVEGSTGVLHYCDKAVRINTRMAVLAFEGRGLSIKCISPTCVIIEGFIINLEFIN